MGVGTNNINNNFLNSLPSQNTTNFYSFSTSPIIRSTRISRRSRNIIDTSSNFLLEETFNTLFDTTYGNDFIYDFMYDNIYDNLYESTMNRSFEENRDKELLS